MMHALTSVVFDFGGVVTYATVPWRALDMAEHDGIPKQLLRDGYARYRHLMDGGFLTPEQMYGLIFADGGFDIPESQVRVYVAADRDSFITSTGQAAAACMWAQRLKSMGYRIGVLSNMTSAFAPVYRDAYKSFFDIADAVVLSCDVLAFKPQPRIYRAMEERLGAYGEQVCLVDDSAQNCDAARSIGWHSVQFKTQLQAESALQRLVSGDICDTEVMA